MSTAPELPKLSLSPVARDYISFWPAGEVRDSTSWNAGPQIRNIGVDPRTKNSVSLTYKQVKVLETLGYLTIGKPKTKKNQYGHDYQSFPLTRTDKELKPYKKRENKVYKGVFPWGILDHWDNMQKAAPRRFRETLRVLDTHDRTSWTYGVDRDHYEAVLRYPITITTKSELDTARRLLCWIFEVEYEGKGHKPRDLRWMPTNLTHLLSSGQNIRWLLLDLLVDPIFEDDGKCVGFRALDPDEAEKELDTFANGTGTLLEKYQNYMQNRWTPQLKSKRKSA